MTMKMGDVCDGLGWVGGGGGGQTKTATSYNVCASVYVRAAGFIHGDREEHTVQRQYCGNKGSRIFHVTALVITSHESQHSFVISNKGTVGGCAPYPPPPRAACSHDDKLRREEDI